MEGSMQITPYENGIHSLAIGIGDLEKYVGGANNQYLLKGAIISIHHGVETLLKDVLFQRNPVFLLDDKAVVKKIIECYKSFYEEKNHYLFDDEHTIKPIEALKRVKELSLGHISERDYQALSHSYTTLNSLRNQLQHFTLTVAPDHVIMILGELLPKFSAFIETCYELPVLGRARAVPHVPLPNMGKLYRPKKSFSQAIAEFNPGAMAFIELLKGKYDVLLNEAIGRIKGKLIDSLTQKFIVNSRGACGAPPYDPDIILEGWLNARLEPHRHSRDSYVAETLADGAIKARYTAKVEFGPVTEEPIESYAKRVKQSIKIASEILVQDAESILEIGEFQSCLEYLRDISVSITVELDYETIITTEMYSINHVESLKGQLTIALESGVFGDPTGSKQIRIVQNVPLTKQNTRLGIHSWTSSQVEMNERASLNIAIDGQADLVACN